MLIKKQIANILTLSNFVLGVIALILLTMPGDLLPGNYDFACILIILASFLDRFDGKIARKFNAVSDFGKQLDSLSDLVSFGVAPAVLSWRIYYHLSTPIFNIFLLIVIILFAVAGACRLAKFNIQEDASYFIGIPITLAGSLTAIINLIYLRYGSHFFKIPILLVIALLGYLMIAKFEMKKR